MKFYELNCLIRPDYENEINEVSDKIKTLLTKAGAEIKHISEPSRISLGYSIQKYKEALMVNLFFDLEESKVISLNKELTGIKGVLRSLLAVSDPQNMTMATDEKEKKEDEQEEKESDVEEVEKEKEEIIEENLLEEEKKETKKKSPIENIDKELDDILNN